MTHVLFTFNNTMNSLLYHQITFQNIEDGYINFHYMKIFRLNISRLLGGHSIYFQFMFFIIIANASINILVAECQRAYWK